MTFLKSLVSKKLMVTSAAVAFVQTLPVSPEWQASLSAGLALGFVLAQAYVDAAVQVAEVHTQAYAAEVRAPKPEAE